MTTHNKIVGIGELAVSGRADAIIKTYGLGSCVALILHDADKGAGGMAHIALPDSANASICTAKRLSCPIDHNRTNNGVHKGEHSGIYSAHYADMAVPALLRRLFTLRGTMSPKGLTARLAGGANVLPSAGRHAIGKRNANALLDLLYDAGIPVTGTELGGNCSRSVFYHVGSGTVTITSPGCKERIL